MQQTFLWPCWYGMSQEWLQSHQGRSRSIHYQITHSTPSQPWSYKDKSKFIKSQINILLNAHGMSLLCLKMIGKPEKQTFRIAFNLQNWKKKVNYILQIHTRQTTHIVHDLFHVCKTLGSYMNWNKVCRFAWQNTPPPPPPAVGRVLL